MSEEVTPVQEPVVEPTPAPEEPPKEAASAPEPETDKDYNFRQMRESKRVMEEEINALRTRVDEMSRPKAPEEEQMGSDELIEKRHLDQATLAIKKYIDDRDAERIPDRLKSKFSDFESVVNEENLKKLKKAEPEMFQSLIAGQDLYAKGVSAYKTLKALGIASGDEYAAQKQELERKTSKPSSGQAVGSPALHEAGMFAQGLTPTLKEQLRAEMIQAQKMR